MRNRGDYARGRAEIPRIQLEAAAKDSPPQGRGVRRRHAQRPVGAERRGHRHRRIRQPHRRPAPPVGRCRVGNHAAIRGRAKRVRGRVPNHRPGHEAQPGGRVGVQHRRVRYRKGHGELRARAVDSGGAAKPQRNQCRGHRVHERERGPREDSRERVPSALL